MSTQAEEGKLLKDGDVLGNEDGSNGVYTMTGPYGNKPAGTSGTDMYYSLVVRADRDIVINLTDDVTLSSWRGLLYVERGGNVTINTNGHTIKTTRRCNATLLDFSAPNCNVTVNGGKYVVNAKNNIFEVGKGGRLELNNVDVEYNSGVLGVAVENKGGTLIIDQGTFNLGASPAVISMEWYSKKAETFVEGGTFNSTLWNQEGSLMRINGSRVTADHNPIRIDNYGSSINGENKVIINNANVTSDAGAAVKVWQCYNSDKTDVEINGGTFAVTGENADVLRTEKGSNNFTVTAENVTFYGGKNGVNKQAGTVTLKNVTFENNSNEIHLGEGQKITIEESFADDAKVEVEDLKDARQVTTEIADGAFQKNVKLTSADPEYTVAYAVTTDGKSFRYLTKSTSKTVTAVNATAAAVIDTLEAALESDTMVPKDTEVKVAADTIPGKHFTGWTVKVGGEEKEADTFLTADANDPAKVSFTMPDADVFIRADFKDDCILNIGDQVTANMDGSDASVPSGSTVPVDATVHLTATVPEGQHFTGWTVKVGGEEKEADTFLTTPDANDPTKVTFTMPDKDVEVKANFEADPIPDDPIDPVGPSTTDNIQGALSAVVVGAAAGAIAYEAGTGIYRALYMPGIPMPSNRIELAMLLWEHADKPEPVSAALYEDIEQDDTDAQKAARWAVEQGLMKDDTDQDDQKFHPAFPVSKLRVCLTWNAARKMGLFDKTEA